MRYHPPAGDPELEKLILRLVREALQACSDGESCTMGPNAPSSQPAAKPQAHSRGSLPVAGAQTLASPPGAVQPIGDSVISLRSLEGLPERIRQIEVQPAAVITPAAADLLRERRVRIIRRAEQASGIARNGTRATSPSATAYSSACSQWVADADDSQRAVGYVRQLTRRGVSAVNVELPGAATHAAAAGAVGVVVAEVPAVQVDLFARTHSIPAAAVGALAEVARVAAVMTPAVWVLDASRLSFAGRVAVAAECFRISGSGAASSSAGNAR